MVVEEGREETVLSPENRVKFLCSNGGKILPRPVDGHLKYVGGETRVVVVPRDINFSELMKKLTGLLDGDMVLKYQLVPEELDTLISVRCEEDLRHMLDEFYRQDAKSSEKTGTPRLRAFLFPSNPIIIETQMAALDTHSLLHRYIDAINGIVRSNSNISRPSLSLPSTSSSPKSNPPDGYTVEAIRHEAILQNGHQNTRLGGVHRVQSSPNLSSLGHHHPSHQFQHHHQQHLYQSSRLQGPHKGGSGRLASALSVGRSDIARGQMGHSLCQNYLPMANRRGSGGCQLWEF